MMKALDLFCGAGGASMGLYRAGFQVTGVDLFRKPSYPFRFVQADAMTFDISGFDLVWASPPCQAYTSLRGLGKAKEDDPELIAPIRERLRGVPYAIENVVGAPLEDPVTLCGSMFGLAVRRHRLFEASFGIRPLSDACRDRKSVAVYGKRPGDRLPDGVHRAKDLAEGSEAMGIDWMNWRDLTQAIPPAFSHYIATEFLRS